MKKFILIFFLLSCCSYNQNKNTNNLSDIDFSTKLSLKEFKINLSEKQYWAFTKLDLYDLSVGEIAAMIELENKCMFFSGMDKVEDGAYYSKVDQIEAYLLKKLKEEIL